METKNGNVTDLTYLKQLSKGDNGFINEMLIVFIEETPEAVRNLEKYCGEKNWKMLRAVAHKMKPSFTFVGLKNYTSDINSIEEYAETETNLNLLPGLIAKVKDACDQAVAELQEYKKNL